MRPRWPEWVIAIALVVIGVTGVMAIWGGDLRRLVIDVSRGDEPAPSPEAPPQPSLPPGGVPAGPF